MATESQRKYIFDCAARIAPALKMDKEDYRRMVCLQVTGNASIKGDLSYMAFSAIKERLQRDAQSLKIELLNNTKTTVKQPINTSKIDYNSPEELKKNKLRRVIIGCAYEMKWELLDGKPDMDRINKWCLYYGEFKKAFNSLTYNELIKTVTVFKEKLIPSYRISISKPV
jgi:hypothetical protein